VSLPCFITAGTAVTGKREEGRGKKEEGRGKKEDAIKLIGFSH
jgi:hypothetical protein